VKLFFDERRVRRGQHAVLGTERRAWRIARTIGIPILCEGGGGFLPSPTAGSIRTHRSCLAIAPLRAIRIPRFRGLRIGLALSGGGYRAALMHAGVLDAGRRLGLRFTHLSSVSGGSIIAAYYTLGGSPRDFLKGVSDGRFGLLREATHIQNVVRFSHRTGIQARLLKNVLFGETTSVGVQRIAEPVMRSVVQISRFKSDLPRSSGRTAAPRQEDTARHPGPSLFPSPLEMETLLTVRFPVTVELMPKPWCSRPRERRHNLTMG
jgi:hypothetical protein